MATYSWSIDKLYTKDITKDGSTYTDSILRVEATLTGTSETIESIIATSDFDLDMNVDNIDSSFTAYASVTEANVKTWVENRVGIESAIDFLEKINGSAAKGSTDSDNNFTSTFPWS